MKILKEIPKSLSIKSWIILCLIGFILFKIKYSKELLESILLSQILLDSLLFTFPLLMVIWNILEHSINKENDD